MTPRLLHHFLHFTALFTCALLLAGCGGGGSEGGDDAGPPTVSAEDLELGAYKPEAADVPETAGDLANGRAIEARRLAELVVDPATLDERFQAVALPSGALASPSQLTRAFASEDPKLFKDRISGAGARRFFGKAVDDDLDMSVALVSYKDTATAARVVKAIGDKNERNTTSPITGAPVYNSRTSLSGHPEVRASLTTLDRNDPDPSLSGIAAYDQVVVFMFVSSREGQLPLAKRLMSRAYTEQRAALEGFKSTPLEELMQLPVDEDDLSRLVLHGAEPDPDDQEPDVPSIWGPNGALLQQTWAGKLPEVFERAELDVMVQHGSNVYRAGSPKHAARLLDDFEETVTAEQYDKHHEPKGLRDARCYKLKAEEESSILAPNFCQVQYGRYVAETAGISAEDAEARISAQYLLLQEELGD